MMLDELRRKRVDRTPVLWRGAYGRVTRVAHDGSWADMEWSTDLWALIAGIVWRKRQPLNSLADWRHG